jgi:hypothetical protein
MQLPTWTPDQAQAFLRAMKSVATQGGAAPLLPLERELLAAVQTHVLRTPLAIDALEPIDPRSLALLVGDSPQREQLVRFVVLVPYAAMDVNPAKVGFVDRFATALGVPAYTVTELHRMRDHRLRRLVFDHLRRNATDLLAERSLTGRVKYFVEMMRQYRGEPLLAARYQRLAELPRGTLGRSFHDFYRERRFPLPGERGSFTESLVAHDMAHVLGGFDTDLAGEIETCGLEAGMLQRPSGYELLLDAILDFYCALSFPDAGATAPGCVRFDPEIAFAAYERGAASNTNLFFDWDCWSVIDEPVAELRRRYEMGASRGDEMSLPIERAAHAMELLRATGS